MIEGKTFLTVCPEGGHAIVGLSVVAIDPIQKAAIIPRGRVFGIVTQFPSATSCRCRWGR